MAYYPGIEYLNQLPQWDGTFSSGTERPLSALKLLGNPQDKVPAIHVAGTNGKGTTCSTISNILISAGYRVGLHVSPHLVDVTERCVIQGLPVASDRFDDALQTVRKFVERRDIKLTFFELSTIAAFLVFAERKLDWIVIEVGLGGRWDATNLMSRPRATVLTSVALDHTHLLGASHQLIAREKSQIFRPNVPAFIGYVDAETRAEVEAQRTRIGCPAYYAGEQFSLHGAQLTFAERTIPLPLDQAGLMVEHQRRNAGLAAAVAAAQGISDDAIWDGVIANRWPGRLEGFRVSNSKRLPVAVLTDGAHNPDGVIAFADYLESVVESVNGGDLLTEVWSHGLTRIKRLIFVVSILTTKDAELMLAEIAKRAMHLERRCGVELEWIFTESGHRLSNPAESLSKSFGKGVAISDPVAAFAHGCNLADENSLVVVTGSLYLLGKLRPQFTQAPFSTRVAETVHGL